MKQLFLLLAFRHRLGPPILLGLISVLAIGRTHAQIIRYVKPDGTGTGSSWATASANLQAIINASSAGDQVWVAAGTYKPSSCTTCSATDRMMSFSMKNGVALYGGFVGTESALSERPASVSLAQPSSTTLSGDLGTLNDRNDNSVHVIVNNDLTNTAALDGFVITGAYLELSGSGIDYNTQFGGAMGNLNSSPTIRNCFFTNNFSSFGRRGIGLYNDATSSPTITNCTFNSNFGGYGAAIYSAGSTDLTNCVFTNNSSSSAAPVIIFKGIVTNCTFSSNSGNSGPDGGATGGALSIGAGSVLTNCLFVLNYVVGNGGALAINHSTVTNCTFRGNRSSSGGAGIQNTYGGAVYASNTNFINCSFTGNQATTRSQSGGGAAFTVGGQFVNCSFAQNFCDRTGGAVFSTNTSFVNCAIWGNTPNGVVSDSTIAMTYTDTQDNTPGTGNFSLDPLFVDAPGDNLRLRACSPAIDKGDNAANSATTDLNNSPRLVRQIDLGAYEFQSTPQSPLTIIQQPVSYFSIPQGGTFTASVSASGSVSTYQWYKDGVALSGATSATLTVSNLSGANQGRYYVVVTGSCNSVTSNEIVLIVNTGMYTVKAGRWDDASVWSMNRVPASGDLVRIKHQVTVPGGYVARARQLSYDQGQTVQLQNSSKLVAQ
jgi:hypothetical protein